MSRQKVRHWRWLSFLSLDLWSGLICNCEHLTLIDAVYTDLLQNLFVLELKYEKLENTSLNKSEAVICLRLHEVSNATLGHDLGAAS